jgi:ketosteroid isomerase-like protein
MADQQNHNQEIHEAEKALYGAMIDKDIEALDNLLAEDLEYCHSTAVAEDKALYLSRVGAGHYDYRAIESDAVTLRVDGDLAVMNGRMRMSVATGGGPVVDMRLLFVLVWTYGDSWRLSLRQTTNMQG